MKRLITASVFSVFMGISAASMAATPYHGYASIFYRIETSILQFFGIGTVQLNTGSPITCVPTNAPTCTSPT